MEDHPLWPRLQNWQAWQHWLDGVKINKPVRTHDDENSGVVLTDECDAENVIERALAQYRLHNKNRYETITNYLLKKNYRADHSELMAICNELWPRVLEMPNPCQQ